MLSTIGGEGNDERTILRRRARRAGGRIRRFRPDRAFGGAAGEGRAACRRDRRHHRDGAKARSEEHTSELQSLMRISYAVFCLKKKNMYEMTSHNTHQ